MGEVVCAVDVGTGSARAGIIGTDGTLLGRAEAMIAMRRPRPGHAEQDSEDIWRAVCKAVRAAIVLAAVNPEHVAGIAFDATCSLVVRDANGKSLPVSTDGADNWDTIVWLDHRALAEADICTATGHPVLAFAGGVMSPEMAIPKVMWLKRYLPATWQRTGHLFDLADFLSWRASGSLARSQSTLTCKWTYLAHRQPSWQGDFLDAVDLGDMLARGGLPERATPVGTDLGPLTQEAAAALGLTTRCRVASGLIDAYAGALGVLGAHTGDLKGASRHMALIAGTSSCVMMMASEPIVLPGFWGPYFDVSLPGCWMSEGGQSATGALLDHIVATHARGGEPTAMLHARIADRVWELRQQEGQDFAARLHVLPDFHGNRSPLADPHARGVVSGLTLDASFDGLCRVYWRTCVAIALGVRQVLDVLRERGLAVDTLHVTGGHTKNPLLMELYADVTGCSVTEPVVDEAVLVGTAMAASVAAGLHGSLADACRAMHRNGGERRATAANRQGYERDYRVFLEMQRQRAALDRIA